MFRFTKPQGTFATFTAASAVRKGLENSGFDITKRKGFGKKRECLSGQKTYEKMTALSAPWFHSQPANLNEQDIAIIGGGLLLFAPPFHWLNVGPNQFIAKMSKLPSMHLATNKVLFIRN